MVPWYACCPVSGDGPELTACWLLAVFWDMFVGREQPRLSNPSFAVTTIPGTASLLGGRALAPTASSDDNVNTNAVNGAPGSAASAGGACATRTAASASRGRIFSSTTAIRAIDLRSNGVSALAARDQVRNYRHVVCSFIRAYTVCDIYALRLP